MKLTLDGNGNPIADNGRLEGRWVGNLSPQEFEEKKNGLPTGTFPGRALQKDGEIYHILSDRDGKPIEGEVGIYVPLSHFGV